MLMGALLMISIDQGYRQRHPFSTVWRINYSAFARGTSPVEVANPRMSNLYPRIDSPMEIQLRSAAIVDNLDEIILLPQGLVFPLRQKKQGTMRHRRVEKSAESSATKAKNKSQEDEYDDYENYTLN